VKKTENQERTKQVKDIEKKKIKLFRIETSKNGYMKPFFDLSFK